MRNSLKMLLCLMIIGCYCAIPASGQTLEGSQGNWTWTATTDLPLDGIKQLRLEGFSGSLIIRGDAVGVVTMTHERDLSYLSAEEARSEAHNGAIISRRDGSVLMLEDQGMLGRENAASLTLVVPPSLLLDIKMDGGSMRVQRMDGSVTLYTGAGNISVSNGGGDVHVRTGAGNVSLDDVSGNSEIHTGAGAVKVRNAGADLSITSGGGSVDIIAVEGRVSATTAGGSLSVSSARSDLELYTAGGDVHIAEIRGNVKASTAGGEIHLDSIKGWADVSSNGGRITGSGLTAGIKARTLAGDILLEETRGHLDVRSEVGNIDIRKLGDGFADGDESRIEAHFGSVSLSLMPDLDALLSLAILENGNIRVDEKQGELAVLSERPSTFQHQLRRAEYKLGDGGGSLSISTRSGDIRVRITDN